MTCHKWFQTIIFHDILSCLHLLWLELLDATDDRKLFHIADLKQADRS